MAIAVIAGTGLTDPMADCDSRMIETPFGRAFLSSIVFGHHETLVLPRHGTGLNVPPHLINYRANMWALKAAGVDTVIATAAVGSLVSDLLPGSLAVVTDFIDFTKRRPGTFQEEPERAVSHADMSVSYCPDVRGALFAAAGSDTLAAVVYACMEGPRYETPAEVRMLSRLGADVVGMTGVPEVVLAKELGICYGTLAIITNYAAGISSARLSHDQIASAIRARRTAVREIIGRAISLLAGRRTCSECRPNG